MTNSMCPLTTRHILIAAAAAAHNYNLSGNNVTAPDESV